jgi:hypothetical protein
MSKNLATTILTFLGNKTPCKKQNEVQKLFLEDLVLIIAKGFFPLSICENIWMHRLVLMLDPKLVFLFQKMLPNEILPNTVTCCLD